MIKRRVNVHHMPQNMPRRRVLGALAACVALPITGGATRATTPPDFEQKIADRVRHLAGESAPQLRILLPNGAGGNVRPVIQKFVDMTGVAVTVKETPVDDINTELLLDSFSQAKRFDVALPATFGLPDLASAGAILPITAFANAYEPAGFRDDILYGVGDRFDEEIYGFQTDGDAYVMFYHKEWLQDETEQARYADRFGAPLSRPDTWGELDQQMAFFNRPDDGMWGGLLFRTPAYVAWEWWARFHAKGVWPFSTDMEPQIASDAGVEALEDMVRASAHLCPDSTRIGLFENWERFARGDVYCNIGWGGSQKYFNGSKSQMRDNMVFGPLPGGQVDGQPLATPYFNWGWNYVVTRNSPLPEISYLFALFASTPSMSTLAVRQTDGYFDPFRPEHYEDAGIQAAYSKAFLKVHRHSMENAIPDLYLQNQSEYFRALGDWVQRALRQEVSPKVAMERAAMRWRLITNRSDKTKQKKRWAELRQKYPKNTRKLLKDIT